MHDALPTARLLAVARGDEAPDTVIESAQVFCAFTREWLEGDVSALELRDLVGQVVNAARQVLHAGEPAQIAQAKDVLRDARRKLYRILAEDSPEPSETAPAEPEDK